MKTKIRMPLLLFAAAATAAAGLANAQQDPLAQHLFPPQFIMEKSDEIGLTEAWHSLRIVNVADGTNEILNRTIAARLLKGDIEL